MKRVLLLLQVVFLLFFVVTLFLSVCEITGTPAFITKHNYTDPVYNGEEHFDPSLQRINSIDKLVSYCDSLYENYPGKESLNYNAVYTQIIRKTVRSRFYHGYSTFGFGNNYLALIGDRLYSKKEANLAAIVIPDDIMKFPFGACSQQCIVLMEALNKKGFSTRPIGFVGNKKTGGHFCLEVFFDGSWHFFDPDMEPDYKVFEAYNYPDVKTIAANKDILFQAYRKADHEKVSILFSKYSYGAIDKFPAKRGLIFQYVSMFFSYTLWLFFGAGFLFIRRKYLALSYPNYVRHSRFFIPFLFRGRASENYPDYSASRA